MIRTGTAMVSLREDGIVHVIVNEGAGQTLKDAKENFEASISYCSKEPLLLLVDIRTAAMLDSESRHFYANQLLEGYFRAFALLTNASALGKTIGNIYLAIAKHTVPAKLHSNEEEAVQWLKSH